MSLSQGNQAKYSASRIADLMPEDVVTGEVLKLSRPDVKGDSRTSIYTKEWNNDQLWMHPVREEVPCK